MPKQQLQQAPLSLRDIFLHHTKMLALGTALCVGVSANAFGQASQTPSSAPALSVQQAQKNAQLLQTKQALGAVIFHDVNLSNPVGQSCASCHKAANAFADEGAIVSEGAVKGAFGNRNTASLKYASFSPAFGKSEWDEEWRGGQFWDGRASDLKAQALGPLLNPVEMNNTVDGLAKALRAAGYASQFTAFYGPNVLADDTQLTAAAADALAAFQQSELFAPFDAKYDYAEMGLVKLTAEEERGQQVFDAQGMCIDCHAGRDEHSGRQLFTQFKFHNIKVPRNPALPFYVQPLKVNPAGKNYVDIGLAANPQLPPEKIAQARGLFKSPTLRNIALTAPYMHNGVFKTLEEVVDYYNKMEDFWPAEVDENRSRMISSALDLSDTDKAALVAFLKTLTDGYPAPAELKAQLRVKQAER